MAQASKRHGLTFPLRVKPLNQCRKYTDLCGKRVGNTDRPLLSVIKLEPSRNGVQQNGSKPKSTTPQSTNQELPHEHKTHHLKFHENLVHCGSHNCVNTDHHRVSVFPSVGEALKTLPKEKTCKTLLVCLEDVFRTLPIHITAVKLSHVNKLMNHSQSDIQKQLQENFEEELKKRLQRKSPVEKVYKDSSMEKAEEGCVDLYCDTPVKQNTSSTGKPKPKGKKKVLDGQSPRSSPGKQSSKKKPDSDPALACDGINKSETQDIKQGKKKGKGSPSKKNTKSMEGALIGDYTNSTPEKQIIKRKKPKVKIDPSTTDIETISTSYTPSPDSCSRKSSLNLSLTGLTSPGEGKELHIYTNHNDSANSSHLQNSGCSISSSDRESKPMDSPSSLSPSKELGRRIRAPNVRYSDDILLLPLKSPRRSRSPKGSAEKEGASGVPDESPTEHDSPEKVKKSSECQTSQLYSLLTNKGQTNKSVIEKTQVMDNEQKGQPLSLLAQSSMNPPLTNGVVDDMETESVKSSEKPKKKRKKKSDGVVSEKLKPKSVEKSEKKKGEKVQKVKSPKSGADKVKGPKSSAEKVKSPKSGAEKVKSPKSGAIRALQFDEGIEETGNTENKEEDAVEKTKETKKGRKAGTPKKPRKTPEKGKKASAKSSPEVLESVNETTGSPTSSKSKSEDTDILNFVDSNSSRSLDLFSLIAKVKDNINTDTFPTFADEVLLKAEEDDTNKEDSNEKNESDSKPDSEKVDNNSQSLEIVDDFFSADFLKVSPKHTSKSPSREKAKPSISEETSTKPSSAKLESILSNIKIKKNSLADKGTMKDSACDHPSSVSSKTVDTSGKEEKHVKIRNVGRLDGKVTTESTSSFDPSVPLMIDTQERRNIFDMIMTDYPSPNNIKGQKESSEKHEEKAESDKSSSDAKAHSDIRDVSPKANENLSLSLQSEKSVIEKIQVKLGIPLEESPNKQSESSDKCDSPKKQSEVIKSPSKSTPSLVNRASPGSKEDRRDHNSTKGSSDYEVVMDTVDEHQMLMDVESDSNQLSPPDGKSSSSRPVPRTSTQRVTKEPTPLSVLSTIETEVQDVMSAFTSNVLDEYLDTKTNRKVKLSRPIKRTDSEERLVDSEDELEEVTEMPERYDEFSGMIEQCEPSFDEVDGVLFTSFANEEALNAHVKVEKKTKIGRNESILLGMARMKNLRVKQNQIRNSVHQKKDARLKALKEQYKINQSLQGMHLVLLKYQRVFKRELILELMAKEQESPGSVRGKTPKKTSDITQIKGWKNKFGPDGEALEMKASKGKLHWRTEERLLRNHDPEQLKQMGLDLKKKRRKNLVFTIRKGMSKGDPSRMEKVDLTSHTEEEEGMEGGEENQDGENSFGQELVEMGYEILDTEKQKLRDKKLREKYKKYLMMKLKLNNEDIDILKKLGGQRLRSMLKPESPKKLPPPPPPTPPPTEEGDKDGDTTTEGSLDTPSKKKRKRKKNYFCIITLNSSMANAALSALHPKFVVKTKKKPKAVKSIKKEVVDPEIDKQSKGGAKEKAEDKAKDRRPEENEIREEFDKMCDKPGCRYGCICHLCKFSGGSPETTDLSNMEKKCTKEYCRLGCICDDNLDKVSKHHCGKPECMIECTCDPVARRRTSRSSSTGEKVESGGNSEDSQPVSQEDGQIKKPGKKAQVIPQRKSTYRLAKNLDAVSRKAMLVYEASEKFESQKTRTRKKQDSNENQTPNFTVEHVPKQQVMNIPQTEVSTAAPLPPRKPQVTLALVPNPGLPMTGPVTISIPQPKIKPTPIQTEMYRKAAVALKPQSKKTVDDSEMALFESDSEAEDIQEVVSCARVDAQYTRGYHPKKCTCGKEHVQSRAVSSQCPSQGGGQMASSGLSALQHRLTGKPITDTVWQTQWVCLKSNKPPTEGDSVKLLEILSNSNWEPHKQKILSRISRHIHHKNQPEGQADSYPQPCLIHIGEFEIEFLPKSSKPATIPPEVRNNMPSAIFSIRVRISARDLNFPKLFKALPLDSTVKNKNTSSSLPDKVNITNKPPQPVNAPVSDGEMNKSSLGVTGISGFSRLQINNRSIVNKDGNSPTDRSHLHPISTQQMTQMKPSQLHSPLQIFTSSTTIQSSGARLVTPQTVTVTKVLPAVPTVSHSITVSSTASQSTTTSSLTSVPSTRISNIKNQESSISVISSIGSPSVHTLKSMMNYVTSSSTPTIVMSSEKPIGSTPIISTLVKGSEVFSRLGAIITSSVVPSQTHPTSNPINVTATSVITATTSVTTDKPVTSISVIKQSPGQSSQSVVSKSTLVSLHSVLQNKTVASSSPVVAKPLYLATPVLSSTETKVPVSNNTMQVHDLRPPASLSMTQVQEKVCVLGPKSSPVTLLGPFTSPSSIPKVLPQMKIIQSSILDKDGKPVIHLVPFTGPVYGKPSPMTSVLKSSPVVNSGTQAETVSGIKNPTNVYTLSDVSTTTTNIAHVSNASTTVTQSTVPAMSEKVQGPLLPKLGDQILLVSSDEQNLKLLNKLKACDNPRNDQNKRVEDTNSKVIEDCSSTEVSKEMEEVPQQSNVESVSVKRKLDDEREEERKKLKTSESEDKKSTEGGTHVKESESVLAKILLSDAIKETYSKYRDITADVVKEDTKAKKEETPSSTTDKESIIGSKEDEESKTTGSDNSGNPINGDEELKDSNREDKEKTQEVESESECGSPDNRGLHTGADLDSSCDKSDESDATVVGGIEADQKDSEGERGDKTETDEGKAKEDQTSEAEEQVNKSDVEQNTEKPSEPEVIYILDSPVKKPSGNTSVASDNVTPNHLDKSKNEAGEAGAAVDTDTGVTSEEKEWGLSVKRRLSQEEVEGNKKLRTEEKAEESEEDLCMTVEDTDDMAVIIPNEDCVEIINSSDEEIDIETETDVNMNKLLRKQSDNRWEFFNPNCNVHCINKKPHAKRKSNHKTISNVLKDDFHFKEGVLSDPKTRKIQMKKTREKQRREEMRISFKALAESMYGEDKDDTKYSQILNHTEPKVQLLNKAKEKIEHMEKISRLMTNDKHSTQARNAQLQSKLKSLKEFIIQDRGMSWMVLQAHLDKISKVCKKIFQNMPAILKKRAMERRAATGSSGNVPGSVRLNSPFTRPGFLSRAPGSALASNLNGPVPIQMVSSEQVRSMAKSQELARSKENISSRPDIYIDYAEEEHEICEDLMRREEKNRRKQIHEVNMSDDFSFEIGDLPSLFKKGDYLGNYSPQEGKVVNNSPTLKSEALNNMDSEDEKVIIADEYDDSGKMTVYRLNSNPVVEVPMSNTGKIVSSESPKSKPTIYNLEDGEEETPMLVITEVKSLSSDH
ncbi:uncharacterized protein LOC133174264 [Saccostrea echinata]|uniref:uncharacterized protein LOC133174264 n=1 Tax=Saccostrea echinata TaxID=191078 RepID=UPI002A8051FC|nr:uncharacterized protein LOC133174264 [Saccostrea echinata]